MSTRERDEARVAADASTSHSAGFDLKARLAESFARVPEPSAAIWPAPVAGLVAGIWAFAMSLLVVAALVVAGWIFAPMGGGQFGDAMRAAGHVWLLGDGGSLNWEGAAFSLPPLLLTFMIILFQRRAARWLASAVAAERVTQVLQPLLFAVAASASAHLLLAVAVAGDSAISVPRNLLGSALVSILGFGWGLDRALESPRDETVRVVLHAVRLFTGVLLVASLILVLASAAQHRQGFIDVLTAVSGDANSTLQVLAVCVAYLPTLVIWAAIVLLGGTVVIGAGADLSLSEITLGPLPPVPLLAILPAASSEVARLLLLVPLLAALAALWAMRGHRTLVHRVITVAGVGVMGALLGGAGSGAFGPGRLETFGTQWWMPALLAMGWTTGALLVDEAARRVLRRLAARPEAEVDPAAEAESTRN